MLFEEVGRRKKLRSSYRSIKIFEVDFFSPEEFHTRFVSSKFTHVTFFFGEFYMKNEYEMQRARGRILRQIMDFIRSNVKYWAIGWMDLNK